MGAAVSLGPDESGPAVTIRSLRCQRRWTAGPSSAGPSSAGTRADRAAPPPPHGRRGTRIPARIGGTSASGRSRSTSGPAPDGGADLATGANGPRGTPDRSHDCGPGIAAVPGGASASPGRSCSAAPDRPAPASSARITARPGSRRASSARSCSARTFDRSASRGSPHHSRLTTRRPPVSGRQLWRPETGLSTPRRPRQAAPLPKDCGDRAETVGPGTLSTDHRGARRAGRQRTDARLRERRVKDEPPWRTDETLTRCVMPALRRIARPRRRPGRGVIPETAGQQTALLPEIGP
jgi:hypothetical protein